MKRIILVAAVAALSACQQGGGETTGETREEAAAEVPAADASVATATESAAATESVAATEAAVSDPDIKAALTAVPAGNYDQTSNEGGSGVITITEKGEYGSEGQAAAALTKISDGNYCFDAINGSYHNCYTVKADGDTYTLTNVDRPHIWYKFVKKNP